MWLLAPHLALAHQTSVLCNGPTVAAFAELEFEPEPAARHLAIERAMLIALTKRRQAARDCGR